MRQVHCSLSMEYIEYINTYIYIQFCFYTVDTILKRPCKKRYSAYGKIGDRFLSKLFRCSQRYLPPILNRVTSLGIPHSLLGNDSRKLRRSRAITGWFLLFCTPVKYCKLYLNIRTQLTKIYVMKIILPVETNKILRINNFLFQKIFDRFISKPCKNRIECICIYTKKIVLLVRKF